MKSKFIKSVGILLIILCIVVFFSSCTASAPTPPEGYTKESDIRPSYLGFNIAMQFPKINYANMKQSYFIYDDELYYIRDNGGFYGIDNYSVHSDIDSKYLGNFTIPDKVNIVELIFINTVFLNEKYLYYCFERILSMVNTSSFKISEMILGYEKFDYYRYDLETNENEMTSYDQFILSYNDAKIAIEAQL